MRVKHFINNYDCKRLCSTIFSGSDLLTVCGVEVWSFNWIIPSVCFINTSRNVSVSTFVFFKVNFHHRQQPLGSLTLALNLWDIYCVHDFKPASLLGWRRLLLSRSTYTYLWMFLLDFKSPQKNKCLLVCTTMSLYTQTHMHMHTHTHTHKQLYNKTC